MNFKSPSSSSFTISALLIVVLIGAISEFGTCRGLKLGTVFATYDDLKSYARFAVQEHNKRSNALLEFVRVLDVKEQVVAGTLYHFTLETIENGKNAVYDATVWVKPWTEFKQLQEFKRVIVTSRFTISDLKNLRDKFGWHKLPVSDSEVEEAANHAVRAIQERSNSLFPYKLLEILQAEAEVVKDYVKFNLLLKLRRGSKDVELKVNVKRTGDGDFIANLVQQLVTDRKLLHQSA